MTTEKRPQKTKRCHSRMLIVSLIVFASLYQEAIARIGETPEQCQVRYGKLVKADKDKEELQFQKDDILITVRFYNGKADYISFESKRRVSPQQLQGFSDSEIQGLLKANGGMRSWMRWKEGSSANEPIRNYGPATWWTVGGTLRAKQLGVAQLIIITKDHQCRFEKEEKAKKDKKLEGF